MTYSEKVKFILDYVILFGVQSNDDGLLKYHYELSKNEIINVDIKDETIEFFMFNDKLDSIRFSASQFSDNQEAVIEIFYDNCLSKLSESITIPDDMADKVRNATEEAHKEWDGVCIIREKTINGVTQRVVQIPITGTCLLEMAGYITKSYYLIRFCTGEFFDLSDPIYERLFNKK